MTKLKWTATILTVALLTVALLTLSVSAAETLSTEEYNSIVYEHAHRIHQTYGIDIRYPLRSDGYAAIGSGTLETLEKTLRYITPSVVSQLSNYYYQTRGSFLTFRFAFFPTDLDNLDINALARFNHETAVIELFIPSPSYPMTMSGSSPIAIAHEVGHAFYRFFAEKHGQRRFEREWEKLRGPHHYSYNWETNPDKYCFASNYAAVSAEEDFSETFAYLFVGNRAGLGMSPYLYQSDNRYSVLGQKYNFIKKIIPYYMTNTSGAIYNTYTSLYAPDTLTYRKIPLSGNSLEYIDFPAPYGILSTVLSSLKIEEKSSTWISEVGGWEVSDYNGGFYLVFPGSTFVTLRIPDRT